MTSKQKPTNEMRSVLSRVLTLFSLCGIIVFTTMAVLERWSLSQRLLQISTQHSLDKEKTNDQPGQRVYKGHDSVLEELDLEEEWKRILGDESDLDFLGFNVRGI